MIREAEDRDIPEIDLLIARVWDDRSTDLKCLAGESRFTSKELPGHLQEPSNCTMVYVQPDGSIAGVLFLSSLGPTVVELGITAFPYGRGTGTSLIERGIEAATACGVTEIYLDVFERNPAVLLYERHGFSVFDRQVVTNQRGEELPLLRMRRSLGESLEKKTVVAVAQAPDNNRSWLELVMNKVRAGFRRQTY